MKNNFVITGLPRSGTKFLAKVMNKSDKFTVLHDYKLKKIPLRDRNMKAYVEYMNNRLNKENYGEVSGWFRRGFENLMTEKKGIILRHPIKNIISLYNMNGEKYSSMYIDNMNNGLKLIDSIASLEEVKVIKFQDMTNDLDYLNNVLNYFGIDDVSLNDKMIKNKVNYRGSKFTYDNFDQDIIKRLEDELGWFIEKYELELI